MNKQKKDNYWMEGNKEAILEYWSQEQLAVINEHLKSIPPEKIDLPVKFVILKNDKGAEAFLRKIGEHEYTFHTSAPLQSSIPEQRKWIQIANNFYRPRLMRESETRHPSQPFERIVGGIYHETSGEQWDPDDEKAARTRCVMRYRTFAGRETKLFGGAGKRKRRGAVPLKDQRRAKLLWQNLSAVPDQKERLNMVEEVYNQESRHPLFGETLLDVIRRTRPRSRSHR